MIIKNVLSVTELNKYIKDIISRDFILSNLWVKGEMSNFKYHYSGHLYFTIKDEKSLVKCVMFKVHASTLQFVPKDGMKIVIRGYISVFEREGQYQLYVEEMQQDGLGSLHIAFEQLKQKLQKEGLFEENRKRKLPFLPGSIGVITSSTGAVIKDIINILSRRFYNVNIKVYPVQVQGEQAAEQIVKALNRLNQLACVDVIILARGGGSLEELWAFNEEIVARSIYKSNIPVISAIGHETDYTISDFVADFRAPTPSAAAEIVMPEKSIIESRLESLKMRMKNLMLKKMGMERLAYKRLTDSIAFKQPFNKVYQERMKLDVQLRYMMNALDARAERFKSRLSILAARLDGLSPLSSLARGYSIVKSKIDDTLIKSIIGVNKGDKLEIIMQDGKIECTVDGVLRVAISKGG